MEENNGIIFGSWVNRYHNSEGKLSAPKDAPSHEILASITNAEKIDWKGTFWETLFASMDLGFRFRPKAQIKSYLRMPYKVFAKSLPAGAYSIFYIEMKQRWWKADIRFSVRPRRITYIGLLQCNLCEIKNTQKFRLGGGEKKEIGCRVTIKDNLDKDQELFEKKIRIFNPDIDWEVSTRLMEGRVLGIREKEDKTNLHSIEISNSGLDWEMAARLMEGRTKRIRESQGGTDPNPVGKAI